MVIVRVKLSPDVDEPASVILRRVQDVRKRGSFGLRITGSFVPVCLWIAKVCGHGRHVRDAKNGGERTDRWQSVRR